MGLTLVWLRNDLRLADHPALYAAGEALLVFVWHPEGEAPWAPGAASRWWLHHSLAALGKEVAKKGGGLVLRAGDPAAQLVALARETGAETVHFTRRVEPWARRQEHAVEAALKAAGVAVRTFAPNLLVEPDGHRNGTGGPFQVFTPFWKTAAERVPVAEPLPAPARLAKTPAPSARLESLGLLPKTDWAGGFRELWVPGEAGAGRMLDEFLGGPVAAYPKDRDIPGVPGTAQLSPHLHFGEISPRAAWHAAAQRAEAGGAPGMIRGVEEWVRQLYWREFGHYMVWHFPHTPEAPLRTEFGAFPWRDDGAMLRAWQRGLTGYPIVDAGMRELWHTGWMHNRVRMIAASFLVKDLLIPWQRGAEWFWDTLVDADLGNNTLGWQWTAGCGPDAAPYFRVFNPVLQGAKFDPDGAYVRRWVPELAGLDNRALHAPWTVSEMELLAAGVRLGDNYPRPVVEHAGARDRALLAYEQVKRAKAEERRGL